MSEHWPDPQKSPYTLFDVDDDFHNLYENAQRATQMDELSNPLRRQRFYILYNLARQYPWPDRLLRGIAVAEAGCFRGLSAYILASAVRDKAISRFCLFDSFEGLSQREIQDEASITSEQRFCCSLEQVQQNLLQFDFIDFYKGWIPDCFQVVKGQCAYDFVHIDVDLYEPTRQSLMYFMPKMSHGGIVVVDDYGYILQFPGAKQAVDECLQLFSDERIIQTLLPTGQIILTRL